jgi:hypothetical protein
MAYGPLECLKEEMSSDLDVTTLAGAPLWEIGVATRDEKLRGAAGRAFLNAYLEGCAETSATCGRYTNRPRSTRTTWDPYRTVTEPFRRVGLVRVANCSRPPGPRSASAAPSHP